jgi:polyisoprenoid-binding protein YceI
MTDATVSLEVDVNSIDTDNDGRDDHLRTADFFDTKQFPSAFFKSTSCKKSGEGKYLLNGELEMHGQKKPISLEMNVKTAVSPVDNKPITGVHVTGSIKRSDFGIATSTPLEILSDEVMIEANLEFGVKTE